jgi:hypothetical protein
MSARTERGATSFIWLMAVALVAGIVVIVPFVFAGRKEAKHGQDALGQVDRAKHVSAQATLETAIRAARGYFVENGTYQGFGPSAASIWDPAVRYTTGPAAPGVVSIRGVTPTSLVMVTSTGTAYLCIAQNGGVVTYGRADARTAAACTGGW